MKKAATIFAMGALAAFGVAACGSSSSSSSTTAASTTATGPSTTAGAGTASTLNITANASGDLKFDQSNINAKAGVATIDFTNPASLAHDVVLQDSTGAEVGRTDLTTHNTASFTVTLKPGTYTFFCDVPGHEQAGMKGTITVK